MGELPKDAIETAERLTRLARTAVDDSEAETYRAEREEILREHGYTARIREDDDTLVLYPAEWIEGGTVRFDRIDDTSRAVEVPLSAPNVEGSWERVEAHNAALVDAVEDAHGSEHAANVRAFADYMGNHYLAPVEEATPRQLEEFKREYYPRNAWPSEKQRSMVDASLELLFEVAETECPEPVSE